MKRAIVTGGAGFIGSHLVDLLLENGYDVTVIDNMATGRRENLNNARKSSRYHFVKDSVNNMSYIKKHFEMVDVVFHLAALADIVPSIEKPILYHQANCTGTISTLALARKMGVKKFVYAASSSCYGIPKVFPTKESDRMDPQYPYALTKMMGEQYVAQFSKLYKMNCTSLRLFNVYGPRSRTSGAYGAVLGVFLKQALSRMPFTVVGDGMQKRDFVYVTDVARAFFMAGESDATGSYNVGMGEPRSIKELCYLIDPVNEIDYIPYRPGEPDMTWADISDIKRDIGWSPTIPLETGVKMLMENMDHWKDAPLWDRDSIDKATKAWFEALC